MERKTVISTIALVALGAAGGLLWKNLETRRLEAQRLEPLPPQRVEEAPEVTGTAGTPASQAPAASPGMPAAPAAPRHEGAPVVTSAEVLQKRAQARSRITDLYPALAADLELSVEEADGFLDLLARQQVEMAALDGMRTGAEQRRRLQAAAEAEQAAMLGGKFEEWQAYQQTQMTRDPVDRMQLILTGKGNGLRDDQIGPMADALAAEQKRITSELVDASRTKGQDQRELLQLQLQRATANNRRLSDVASRHLTRQQLQVYEQVLQEQEIGLRRKLESMDANDDAGGG
jgi:hypothetical protein